MIFAQLVLFFLLLFVIFWQGSMLYAAIIGPPIVYSSKGAIRDCFRLAKLRKGETILDLGCGNGRTLLIAAREFGAKGIGIDRSLYSALKARFNIFMAGQSKNIKILHQSFDQSASEIRSADVIYLYLLVATMIEIEPWLFEKLSPETRVVSLAFEFQKNKPIAQTETINLHRKTDVRLYMQNRAN